MKHVLWLFKWMLKTAIFFTLLAFALNNQHEASLHLFFGHQWRSPMVLIVLAAFATGMIVGVLGMAPRRWRHADQPAHPSGGAAHPSRGDTVIPASAQHGL